MARLPAGMRKTPKGMIEDRFTIEGKRFSVYGKTVQECREKEAKRRAEIEAGMYKNSEELTFRDYLEKLLPYYKKTVKPSTYYTREKTWSYVCDTVISANGLTKFGDLKLKKIDPQTIRDLQAALLKENRTPEWANRLISASGYVFKQAINDRIIMWDPTAGIKPLKVTKEPLIENIHRALTIAETHAFFDAAEEMNSWYYNLYVFLLNTGCRVGEAGAITPADISADYIQVDRSLCTTEDGREIGDTPKTNKSKRSIPARSEAIEAAASQRKLNEELFNDGNIVSFDRKHGTPIFRSVTGKLLQPKPINRDIEAICNRAGIERFAVHAFRDTFATRAIESGMQPKTLQMILGHSKINITMEIYAHVMEETKRDQMAAIEVMKVREA